MKLVKESIDFHRGSEPKKSLSIGKYREIINPIKEDWLEQPSGLYIIKSAKLRWSVVKWDNDLRVFSMEKDSWYKGTNKELTLKNSKEPKSAENYFDWPSLIYDDYGRNIKVVSLQRIRPEELG